MRCPCTSGDTYDACCGPILAGQKDAPTAVRLMRSRFTAFATGDAGYLLRSWHPSTSPGALELDPETQWRRLDIIDTAAGGLLDTAGVVEFEAFYREGGVRGSMRERSRFLRSGRVWRYLDAAPG